MRKTPQENAEICESFGVWMATIGTFAGVAGAIGLFNEWPALQVVGALLVCVLCGTLAALAWRSSGLWRDLDS